MGTLCLGIKQNTEDSPTRILENKCPNTSIHTVTTQEVSFENSPSDKEEELNTCFQHVVVTQEDSFEETVGNVGAYAQKYKSKIPNV